MQLVRPHGGDNHLGLRHQLSHSLCVIGVGHQQGQAGWDAQFVAHLCQFGLAAPRHGPAHGVTRLGCGTAWAVSGVEVFSHQAASEARGAEDNEVVGFDHAE